MANISAASVKQLRDKTGAGMMDCKTALGETGGDMEAAVDWLRTKGLAKAAKKAGRVAAEGLVAVAIDRNKGAVVEVNSETDFVARNVIFQDMVAKIADLSLEADGDLATLGELTFHGSANTVNEEITKLIGSIGENMTLRRTAALSVDDGVVASYVHNAAAPGMGKIGVLVALQSAGDANKLQSVGRQLAMHVAAASPLAVNVDELDAAVVARERAVFAEQARESGKPEAIIDKMVEGRLRKFYQEAVLVQQAFVIDPEKTVEQALKAAEAEVGAPVKVTGFVRFALGEGVEKKDQDFAAEVAAAASPD
jgi:elongation factor Ts